MLTQSQMQTLKADIEADQSFASLPHNSDGAFAIAVAYQGQVTPDFFVWRTSITKDEVYANGFNWVEIDNVTEPKWRVWMALFDNSANSMNPSKTNVRAGINEVWKGTAAKLAVGAYVLGKCVRKANRLEKLLATGDGTEASPATMTHEGTVHYSEIQTVMGW